MGGVPIIKYRVEWRLPGQDWTGKEEDVEDGESVITQTKFAGLSVLVYNKHMQKWQPYKKCHDGSLGLVQRHLAIGRRLKMTAGTKISLYDLGLL